MANTAAVADIVALTVKAALAPLRERIAVLETRAAVPGPAGPAGADGTNGHDGADGLGLDQLRAVQDPADPRVVTLQAVRGDEVKTLSTLRFAIPQFCGAYKADRTYQPGDQVQQSGLWICETAQPGRPGAPESGWKLQVKGTL